jgi:hypothetical protein
MEVLLKLGCRPRFTSHSSEKTRPHQELVYFSSASHHQSLFNSKEEHDNNCIYRLLPVVIKQQDDMRSCVLWPATKTVFFSAGLQGWARCACYGTTSAVTNSPAYMKRPQIEAECNNNNRPYFSLCSRVRRGQVRNGGALHHLALAFGFGCADQPRGSGGECPSRRHTRPGIGGRDEVPDQHSNGRGRLLLRPLTPTRPRESSCISGTRPAMPLGPSLPVSSTLTRLVSSRL